ncbi:endolytic transglycosylase MltG [Spirulina subsalsa]|uniref:endolytic transglycosylase MltG n=1 Tax=Spirulina subsalsa TaxID=54311 RepID=UPI0002DB9C80|nr:endolytic transglycosylase MltG [Spirulina subsalsa]
MTLLRRLSQWTYPLLLLPLMIGVAGLHGATWWYWAISPVVDGEDISPEETQIQLEITTGTSTRQIGQDLEATGMIHSAWAWNIWAFWLAWQNREGGFQAGVYTMTPTQSMPEIARRIWEGVVEDSRVTLPEGWSLEQMGAEFERRQYFTQAEFMAATQEMPSPEEFPWLPPDLPHLEGFLYPDTYQFPQGATPQQVIRILLARFQEVALPLYEAAQENQDLTLQEWVTLASMVEKEAAVAQERPRIAGVFLNRLSQGMRLESDPTVEYGTGIRQTPDQPLTLDQVRQPSPYNTYLNEGLPPTPISSPGVDSLRAVLNPERTEYLFFVANYDGTHVFSRTLEEHEAATQRIRQERERQRQLETDTESL